MIEIVKARLYPYRCIETPAELDLSANITALAGLNEAGKTTILEQLAKSCNYNENDEYFHFDAAEDYPRKKLKELETMKTPPLASALAYKVSKELADKIGSDIGLSEKNSYFTRCTDYSGSRKITDNGFSYDVCDFWEKYAARKCAALGELKKDIAAIRSKADFDRLIERVGGKYTKAEQAALKESAKYFENLCGWENPINEYVYRNYLLPEIPRFIYFDECTSVPSRICLEEMLDGNSEKISRAFISLCGLDPKKIAAEKDLSQLKPKLEIVQAKLSKDFLDAWKSDPNIRIELELSREFQEKRKIFSRKKALQRTFLEIKIKDINSMISLPPEKRSKGFQWFFSFWVWFCAVREVEKTPFILLLDEPGQHLHADAQGDLMRFLRELSEKYRIIYSAHSPYMLSGSGCAERIYRIFKDENGTHAEITNN